MDDHFCYNNNNDLNSPATNHLRMEKLGTIHPLTLKRCNMDFLKVSLFIDAFSIILSVESQVLIVSFPFLLFLALLLPTRIYISLRNTLGSPIISVLMHLSSTINGKIDCNSALKFMNIYTVNIVNIISIF